MTGTTEKSLLTRIVLVNAAVFVAGTVVLAVTPATISAPIALREAVVLVGGLTAILLVNLVLVRRTLVPLRRLTELMEQVEPLEPGRRLPYYGDHEEIVALTAAFNDMLERLEEERRHSLRLSLAAQESERHRVARELHDEVGQTLTALLLLTEGVVRRSPPDLAGEVAELREATREALEQVRDVARRLRPEVLEDLGLRNAIVALCQRVTDAGVPVRRRIDPELPELTPDEDLVVYRIAQEALTNALRHSGARTAELRLGTEGGRVVLTVRDDGRGLQGARPGAGLQGMRERAVMVGAVCRVESPEEGGTMIRLELRPRDEAAA